MTIRISQDDLKKIKQSIRDKYTKAAENPKGLFQYSTGRSGIEAQRYDPELVGKLPQAVISSLWLKKRNTTCFIQQAFTGYS
jgi:hypothetical protein